MNETKDILSFESFNTNRIDEWEEKIKQELRGKDLDQILWQNENFDIQPFYRNEVKKEYPEEYSIQQYLRNGYRRNCKILQEFGSGNNDLILEALANNCSSIRLSTNEINFEQDLKGVIPNFISIYLPEINIQELQSFIEWVKDCEIDPGEISGGINYSPLSKCAEHGIIDDSWKNHLKRLIEETGSKGSFKVLNINGGVFERAGASIVQQLAYSISKGVEYLNAIQGEISIDILSAKVFFEMNIGSSFFLEIAKLRALRILWAKIISAYKPKHQCSIHTYIIGVTSTIMCSSNDPDSNLIRNTSAAMSASIGGCNEIQINNHDGKESGRSFRLARNIQNIMGEESFINTVNDPSEGSYYIDNLTYKLVSHSWDLFMKTEMTGGFLENLKKGTIQANILSTGKQKTDALNESLKTLIGDNKYLKDGDKRLVWSIEEAKGIHFNPLTKIIHSDVSD